MSPSPSVPSGVVEGSRIARPATCPDWRVVSSARDCASRLVSCRTWSPGREFATPRARLPPVANELKLGLNTGYWAGGPPPGIEETIAEAERLGFDSIWTAEAYGSDCLTPLAWWGASTERIRLGTAIVQMSARQPAAAAMAAMTMDHPSGGRFVLGLGVC